MLINSNIKDFFKKKENCHFLQYVDMFIHIFGDMCKKPVFTVISKKPLFLEMMICSVIWAIKYSFKKKKMILRYATIFGDICKKLFFQSDLKRVFLIDILIFFLIFRRYYSIGLKASIKLKNSFYVFYLFFFISKKKYHFLRYVDIFRDICKTNIFLK